jgi:hypothetical protein
MVEEFIEKYGSKKRPAARPALAESRKSSRAPRSGLKKAARKSR